MSEEFDIRYSEEGDLEFMHQWFADPAACDDFPFNFEERLDALKNWIGFARYRASLTGFVGEKVVAIGTLFLMPYKKVAHHCGVYLMVDPDFRKRGIGTSMLRNLQHLAKTRFNLEAVHIEVYEPSHILQLLRKLGYEEIVRQENYVKTEGCSRARIILGRDLL